MCVGRRMEFEKRCKEGIQIELLIFVCCVHEWNAQTHFILEFLPPFFFILNISIHFTLKAAISKQFRCFHESSLKQKKGGNVEKKRNQHPMSGRNRDNCYYSRDFSEKLSKRRSGRKKSSKQFI